MDLSIRDWLMVIGVLLLLAVALDGYRRARRERKNQVKLSRSAKRSARNHRPDTGHDDASAYDVSSVKTYDNSADGKETYAIDPLFDDPFEQQAPEFDAMSVIDDAVPIAADPIIGNLDTQDNTAPKEAPKQPEEIILLNVLATSGNMLNSKKLKAILDACDCRFQSNGVFYRFEKEQGQGDIQFSVVNMVEPGTFGNEHLDGLETPGVSFLLCLPGPENPTEAITCMIETAQCVASNLQASIKDENLCALTDQQFEYHRQQVRNFLQRKLLTSDT